MANMEKQFESWMKQCSHHKYIASTIARYIRALQKAAEWLDTSLTMQVLDTETLEDFHEVEKQIKQVHNFVEVNRNHGHGDLSAALRAYKKFLQERTENNTSAAMWWPSLEEYDPRISKKMWMSLLKNTKVFTPARLTRGTFFNLSNLRNYRRQNQRRIS